MTPQEISNLIKQYDLSALECDGATRVIHTLLDMYKVDHFCYLGKILYEEKEFAPHFWISCQGYIIDYKVKMWMGESDLIKEGVFKDEDTVITYDGEITNIPVLTQVVFNLLTKKI